MVNITAPASTKQKKENKSSSLWVCRHAGCGKQLGSRQALNVHSGRCSFNPAKRAREEAAAGAENKQQSTATFAAARGSSTDCYSAGDRVAVQFWRPPQTFDGVVRSVLSQRRIVVDFDDGDTFEVDIRQQPVTKLPAKQPAQTAQQPTRGNNLCAELVEPDSPPSTRPSERHSAGTQQQKSKQHILTDTDKALHFLAKIKARFTTDDSVYKKFLEIIQAHGRKACTVLETLEQVSILFKAQPDLVDEFALLLPERYQDKQQPRIQAPQPQQPQQLGQEVTSQLVKHPPDLSDRPSVRRLGVDCQLRLGANPKQSCLGLRYAGMFELQNPIRATAPARNSTCSFEDLEHTGSAASNTYQVEEEKEQVSILFKAQPDLVDEFALFLPERYQDKQQPRFQAPQPQQPLEDPNAGCNVVASKDEGQHKKKTRVMPPGMLLHANSRTSVSGSTESNPRSGNGNGDSNSTSRVAAGGCVDVGVVRDTASSSPTYPGFFEPYEDELLRRMCESEGEGGWASKSAKFATARSGMTRHVQVPSLCLHP